MYIKFNKKEDINLKIYGINKYININTKNENFIETIKTEFFVLKL